MSWRNKYGKDNYFGKDCDCTYHCEDCDPTWKKKGKFKGRCNRTVCDSTHEIVWFNHSTRTYYCKICADKIMESPGTMKDSMRLFGHALLTKDEGGIHSILGRLETKSGGPCITK